MPSDNAREMQRMQSASSHESSPTAEPAKPEGEQDTTPAQKDSPSLLWPELPEGWKVPSIHEYWDEERPKHFTDSEKKVAWDAVSSVVKEYNDDMVKRWTDEMDTLLVYAGLFSAILTAFNVQSYAMLTPPGQDPVLEALQRISEQLSSFSINPPFVNSTTPAWQQSALANAAQPPPQRWAVWLNALWFSSLICSLSSASVAIMVKQWLNEYRNGISGNSRHAARLRQYRLDALIKWRVGAIISVLPVMLQISLGLFFAGLLVLLWNLNRQVALAASTLVGALVFFAILTSVLPAIKSDCSYQTPVSLALFNLRNILKVLLRPVHVWCHPAVKRHWLHARSGSRTEALLFQLQKLLESSKTLLSLRATEKSLVQDRSGSLDANIFTMAYTTTLDLSHLNHATICFTEFSEGEISRVFDRIDAENTQHGRPRWTLSVPRGMACEVFLAKCLSGYPRADLSLLNPYFDAAGAVDPLGSMGWNHFLTSCAVIVWHCEERLEPPFWRDLVYSLYSEVSKMDTTEKGQKIDGSRMLHCAAALAYKALQACSKSRYIDWFRDYTRALYVLSAWTRAITRHDKDEDKVFTQALHSAITVAQSKIVEYVQAQQKSDAPEGHILWFAKSSKLESIDGISDGMLDAMVDYANSDNTKILEWDEHREWVKSLKRKRNDAKKETVPMLSQAGIQIAVVAVTETPETSADEPALARPP